MDSYVPVVTGFGVVVLLTAWLPMVLKELPLSLPILCVALGASLFLLPIAPGAAPDPTENLLLVQRLTEAVVLVSLMGAGLKLDRPFHFLKDQATRRLLLVAMPLTIAAIAVLGVSLLGLGLAAAVLLGAALAPTDPVLASDVQVGPPGKGEEDEVRYTLTSEAGLNDGLAFPFVYLAIALTTPDKPFFAEWLALAVVWKIAAGVAIGWVVGRALGWVTFRLPNRARLSRTGDGFVALGITAVAYGLAESAEGYGFLAVFVAAASFRSVERGHRYHEQLHDFIEQLERLLMMVLLVLFGAAMVGTDLLSAVDWRTIGFAVLVIFVVRPLAGLASLFGLGISRTERGVIAFFGIRGIGSGFYLAYGLQAADFKGEATLWAATSMVVVLSILLHGGTVTPVMRNLDRWVRSRRKREGAEPDAERAGDPPVRKPRPLRETQ